MNNKKVKIQGFGVDSLTEEEAFIKILDTKGHVVTINPEMIAAAKNDGEMEKIINEAELVIADGVGVQIGLRILGHKVQRIPGINFAYRLLKNSVKQNQSVALIGSRPNVLKNTIINLKKDIKGINIVMSRDGYYTDEEGLINDITACKPDIILVATGSPKQEKFIYRLKKQLKSSIMIGVGGSFDVWSGLVERAPEFYQKFGLEWLYRTINAPERFKRIFPALPLFVINVLKEKWSGKC